MNTDSIIITGGTIVTSSEEIRDRSLIIRDGKIHGFLCKNDPLPQGFYLLDARGHRIIPGLIDTHVVEAMGMDCRTGSQAIQNISRCLVQHGVTSWLPTLYSVPATDLPAKMATVVDTFKNGMDGAKVLGFHLEGPYFVSTRRGIARDEDLARPDPEKNLALLNQFGNVIRLVTLSPDLENIVPLIEQFAQAGIVVAAGHTAATHRQITQAQNAGLTHVTHIFNAMDDRDWVQPGVVKPGTSDYLLLDDNLTASIIGDGVHVLPEIMRMVIKVKGVDKTIAITDLWPGAGLQEGERMTYVTGEETYVACDAMRMKNDHQLAGATTFLNRCVYNLKIFTGISWPEMVRIGSLNPARLLRVDHQKGDIKIGMDADLLVVDDVMTPKVTILEGKMYLRKAYGVTHESTLD